MLASGLLPFGEAQSPHGDQSVRLKRWFACLGQVAVAVITGPHELNALLHAHSIAMKHRLASCVMLLTTSISMLITARRAFAFAPLLKQSSRAWTTSTTGRSGSKAASATAHSSSRGGYGGGGGGGGGNDYRRGGGGGGQRTSSRPPPRETEVEPSDRIQRDYPHVVLRAGKARLFLEGNPLVYGEAVHDVVGTVADGDFVEVVDHRGNLIGKGCYNSQSMYRVRLLWHARERGEASYAASLEDMVARRVSTAWATRQALGLPNKETTCFRLVNGEGDRLSGLAADVFDKVCVVSSSSLWCERHQKAIIAGLDTVLGPSGIKVVWRRSEARLSQDGFEDKEEGVKPFIDVKAEAQKEGASVWVKEAGIKYKVYPELGQKTGFYCDQRQNRQMIQSLSNGKRVLDLFCYTGGFALNGKREGKEGDLRNGRAPRVVFCLRSHRYLEMLQGGWDIFEPASASLPFRFSHPVLALSSTPSTFLSSLQLPKAGPRK